MRQIACAVVSAAAVLLIGNNGFAQQPSADRLAALKSEAQTLVEKRAKLTQEMVDSMFSFSELGFQEFETQRYLGEILTKNGFKFTKGLAGLPSGWAASWGSGKPVIAIGSDVDGIPKSSQKPGVAYRAEIVPGAPGHGEGHNSGNAVNVAAALALKDIMSREKLSGTIILWPGIAEELLGGKAYLARDGFFKDVDLVIFTHVSSNFSVAWGGMRGTGLVSVEYSFEGSSAHGAGSPWRGRSALDAVELMNVGWNFKREHLHPDQRSHYVISDGGDQPNVVPSKASVWYFIREMTAEKIRNNYAALDRMAEGAALMTDTTFTKRVIGSAWPRNFNRVLAEAAHENYVAVGLPEWSEEDQAFAKAVQKLVGSRERGLNNEVGELEGPPDEPQSGGSDDIGDVSWNVPTITLRYPSNIPGTIGHHWSSGMAMATPIAHKGAVAGAKVVAMTALDFILQPDKVEEAWTYFREEQLGDIEYEPFISADDTPAIEKNAEIMAEFKDELKKYYYNPKRHKTYLEQLGIKYPELEEKK